MIAQLDDRQDHYFDAEEELVTGLIDVISDEITTWPLPKWAAIRSEAPCDQETTLLRILEAIGPVTVKNRHAFDCRLGVWLRTNVHQF
ncbi:MAG: hypothetical protein EXS25_11640 [Pedosphaera sp.]|nr:hypothetical protein [Pedosphaera sp.]